MIFALAAAALNLPVAAEAIGNPARGWILRTDIPRHEWKKRATVGYELTISATGQPFRCEITRSDGSETLNALICSLLMRRAHFQPARDALGKAVPSVMRSRIRWRPDRAGRNYEFDSADIVISTRQPLNPKKPVLIEIVMVQDASGSIETCRAVDEPPNAELVRLACQTAQRSDIAIPVKDSEGNPVRGVRSYMIGFAAGDEGHVVII
jgi:hypothetical protein